MSHCSTKPLWSFSRDWVYIDLVRFSASNVRGDEGLVTIRRYELRLQSRLGCIELASPWR